VPEDRLMGAEVQASTYTVYNRDEMAIGEECINQKKVFLSLNLDLKMYNFT
jgi:hypothetical protein